MLEEFTQEVTEKYLDEFYKSGISRWSEDTISGYTEFASRRKFEVIIDIIRKLNPENILDVGCGGGLFIEELQRYGYKITGIDISYNLLSKIKENKILLSAKVSGLPFKDKTFSCILCTEVLEHILDINKSLLELKRVLKPDGYLIITVPNLHCYDGLEGATGIITESIKIINYIRKIIGLAEIYQFGYNTHLHKHPPGKWRKKFETEGWRIECSFPIFVSPYIPSIFGPLRKMEDFLYSKKLIFNLQYFFEKLFRKIFPFNFLGQLHLFVMRI